MSRYLTLLLFLFSALVASAQPTVSSATAGVFNNRPASGGGGATNNWVTGGVPTGVFTPSRNTLGVQFTPTANITVTALGYWVHGTTEDDIPIGIWTDAAVQLGTLTLHMANYSNGTMGYTNLAAGIPLTAGTTYRIAGLPASQNISGGYYDNTGAAPTVMSDATLVGTCYHIGTTLTFPEVTTGPGTMAGPVSFKYTKP